MEIARIKRSVWRRWWGLRRAREGFRVSRSHLNRITERHEFTVDSRHMALLRSAYWCGWWQSHLYFEPWEAQIRQDLVFTAPLSREVHRFALGLQRIASIGLHVRRADYVTAALHAGICNVAYYHEALAWMRARLVRPEVFVFSDDIPWARDNLGLPGRVTFVDAYARRGDNVDFHLLSRCRHHIIANSTFSWWAAWLAKSDEQLVCAPRRWVNRQDDPGPRMYPRRWKVIDV